MGKQPLLQKRGISHAKYCWLILRIIIFNRVKSEETIEIMQSNDQKKNPAIITGF